jgi:hypothetical protein
MAYDIAVLRADFLEDLSMDDLIALRDQLKAVEGELNGAGGTLLRMAERRIEKRLKQTKAVSN